MSSRGWLIGLTLAVVAAPLAAQQAQAPAEGFDTQTRYQIFQYEGLVRNAVLRAGQQLADRASKLVPGVLLAPSGDPVVRFVPTPEGPVFDVQIPLLLDAGPVLLRMIQSQQQQLRPVPQSNAVPVAQNPDRVAGAGVVAADPMTQSPVQGQAFDPDKEYTAFAREALIDVLLDNSGAVPIKEGERLEIAASGIEVTRGALYPDNSRKLVLVIGAADLTAFRQGKITRDEAKARIKEARY